MSFDGFPPFLRIIIDTLEQISTKNKRHEEFKNEWNNFFKSILFLLFKLLPIIPVVLFSHLMISCNFCYYVY